MASVILGTAGHIDHGKTALVRALTGVDTDRLKEEKARGITIELGFAELETPSGLHFGVVDVPGHEAFVRAMVAGAAGMDVVLLVVAADEGVMPQTREHLAIVDLLDVSELVVALTKCDVVEEEWLELVESDVADVLAETRYAGAPVVATSATAGSGLDELVRTLEAAAQRVRRGEAEDLTRLPLDRVFTIQGTGTVATGTLWSGSLKTGSRVRILPDDLSGRIRGLQVHGRDADTASAGDRTAVALTGEGGDRDQVRRGATLVDAPAWEATWMLTVQVTMLADTPWMLEHNQRVHVHHGTAEVLARVALLEDEPLAAGATGWVQLRLEEPLVARARDRLVLRAYSPVTTIGGGVVAEPLPPKRTALSPETATRIGAVLGGSPEGAVGGVLDLGSWQGVAPDALPVLAGLPPKVCADALDELARGGALVSAGRVFGKGVAREAGDRIVEAVARAQTEDGLRASVPLSSIRAAVPAWAHSELADRVIDALVQEGRLEALEGGVRTPGFTATMTADQEDASRSLRSLLAEGGLAPPFVDELPEAIRSRPDLRSLLRWLEERGEVRAVADGLYLTVEELEGAAERVRAALGGQTGLGPADFREVLPVTRKHLIPLLNYFDGQGITLRSGEGRDVPA